MKLYSKGTLTFGNDKFAFRVIKIVNDKTAVAVYTDNDGNCKCINGIPSMVEVFRKKKDGSWRTDWGDIFKVEP